MQIPRKSAKRTTKKTGGRTMYKQILIDSKFTTGREVKKTKLVGERSH
jgi:hypothetical protein